MPSYLRPGVFVQESLTPLSNALSSPGQATAAFVGTATQGPTTPTLINSWAQYQATFGGFGDGSHLLPFAVYLYFTNGGSGCYVVRAAPSDAVDANAVLLDREGTAAALLKLIALSPGIWGNALTTTIQDNGTGTGRFDCLIYQSGALVERWLDVSMNPADARYLVALINAPTTGSSYVSAVDMKVGTSGYVWAVANTPAVQTATAFTGGIDGVASPNLVTATETLDSIQEILNVNLPGVSDYTVLNPIITWISGKSNVFLVIDAPAQVSGTTATATAAAYTALTSGGSAVTATSYAAIYGPWLQCSDPASAVAGAVRRLPAGGAVLGQYAVSDATIGVQKAPAGVTTALSGVLAADTVFSTSDLDNLNQGAINVIRAITGYGVCIMGARTTLTGYPSRYVSVRRTLQSITKALLDGTTFALFQPNTPALWDTISASITQYLNGLMQAGVLYGDTNTQAFFVICDATNNTPQTTSVGEVHVEVGVALSSPAEFIVISLGQYQSTATATATVSV